MHQSVDPVLNVSAQIELKESGQYEKNSYLSSLSHSESPVPRLDHKVNRWNKKKN